MANIVVFGCRWWNSRNGSTYHSVSVYVDQYLIDVDITYGYGDHYMQTALKALKEFDSELVGNVENLWELKNIGHSLIYEVADVACKKDL